jgi:hypothetical protein
VALQKEYANGKRIENSLQTNGVLLDQEWGHFLAEAGWNVFEGDTRLLSAVNKRRKRRNKRLTLLARRCIVRSPN